MFSVRPVPEELSFAQPCACQNFLSPWLILAGIDGEVALGETSSLGMLAARWMGKWLLFA